MAIFVRLSPAFKKQTSKAIAAIAGFIALYLILMVAALALTFACITVALLMVAGYPGFLTLMLGLGLVSLGVLILIFLIKFIFARNKTDRSGLVELSRKDEEPLFAMIDEIVAEVHTQFPKRVYLSPDVNASVFYDSSFWSMFFPVRKNLQIGLGLVNSITTEELRAILAHEFGHFSQKTMKLGSFVYQVNQIIFNLVNENETHQRLMERWANISGYFSLFVALAGKIIQGIQWLLRQMYTVVNTSYMGLSREMEFHADEIAAQVAGSQPLIDSLLRMDLADQSFQAVFTFYNRLESSGKKCSNVYADQRLLIGFFAERDDIPLQGTLPRVSLDHYSRYNKSKLVVKDQWASHPSTEERVQRLNKLNLPLIREEKAPARSVFKNIARWEKELTTQLIASEQEGVEEADFTPEEFLQAYSQQFDQDSFHDCYNGYYNSHNPAHLDLSANKETESFSKDELFGPDKIDRVYTSISLAYDIDLIRKIQQKEISLKTFDYEGIKYTPKDTPGILKRLEKELEDLQAEIHQHDLRIYQHCIGLEKGELVGTLHRFYQDFFAFDKKVDEWMLPCQELNNAMEFMHQTTPIDLIQDKLEKMKPIESKVKDAIRQLLQDSTAFQLTPDAVNKNFAAYLDQSLNYFGATKYLENNLEILYGAINDFNWLMSATFFQKKKELLDYQASLLINQQVPM